MFSLWSISLFAVGIVLVLMVLFPKQRIFNQVAQASQASTVSTFFLLNLLKAKPEDTDLRFMLAQHQFAIGNMTHAQETVTPLLTNDNAHVRMNAQLFDLHMLKTQTFSFPETSLARRQGIRQIGQYLTRLAETSQDYDSKTLSQFAEFALMIGDQHLAQSMYEQLGQQATPQTAQWYAKAAELALGQGAYQKAATLYFSAQSQAARQVQKRDNFSQH